MGNQNPGYISGRPVNFHLPAATKHWVWCQARQHQETHLPTLPANLPSRLPALLPLPVTSKPGWQNPPSQLQ